MPFTNLFFHQPKNKHMNFTNDPLLQTPHYSIPELEREQEVMQQKIAQLKQHGYQSKQPQAPTWDEIDRITSSLSDKEFNYLQGNAEFQESNATIQAILQREYLRIMRPIVEGTKDGKDALDKHLTLLKRLVKSVKDEADRKDALLNEYITQYSELTWQQFMEIKNGETNKRNRKK